MGNTLFGPWGVIFLSQGLLFIIFKLLFGLKATLFIAIFLFFHEFSLLLSFSETLTNYEVLGYFRVRDVLRAFYIRVADSDCKINAISCVFRHLEILWQIFLAIRNGNSCKVLVQCVYFLSYWLSKTWNSFYMHSYIWHDL